MVDPVQVETGQRAAGNAAPESLRTDVTRTNRPVYLALVWVLGIALLLGIGGWLVLAFQGRTMPEGLAVIIGAISGGLVGLISGKNS